VERRPSSDNAAFRRARGDDPVVSALLKIVLAELYPDDLFTALVGNVDRLPRHRWPEALAIAVALRHSGRADSLARMARRLSATPDARHPSRSHTATRQRRP